MEENNEFSHYPLMCIKGGIENIIENPMNPIISFNKGCEQNIKNTIEKKLTNTLIKNEKLNATNNNPKHLGYIKINASKIKDSLIKGF